MSKKSFRENNPALQFITPEYHTDDTYNTHNTPDTDSTSNTDHTYTTHTSQNNTDAKLKNETKSKRLNLLIQPSLHQELAKIAYIQRVSLNELILRAAREYVEHNQDAIEKYNEFTGDSK